jgi:hypothetical protein
MNTTTDPYPDVPLPASADEAMSRTITLVEETGSDGHRVIAVILGQLRVAEAREHRYEIAGRTVQDATFWCVSMTFDVERSESLPLTSTFVTQREDDARSALQLIGVLYGRAVAS